MEKRQDNLIRLQNLIARGMVKGLDLVTGKDVTSIQAFVDRQRQLHPELAQDHGRMADRLIQKRQSVWRRDPLCLGTGRVLDCRPECRAPLAHSRAARVEYRLRLRLRAQTRRQIRHWAGVLSFSRRPTCCGTARIHQEVTGNP